MNELYDLFRRNFPHCVRAESVVRRLLDDGANSVLRCRDEYGKLIGAAVVQENNIMMLCVDGKYRKRGIGSGLLAEAESVIGENGYASATVGAGREYLMPGIPVNRPVIEEDSLKAFEFEGPDESALRFFQKRGYVHSWDCNCFDMRFELENFSMPEFAFDGLEYRWSEEKDRPGVLECVSDGFEKFVRHYDRDEIYCADSRQRVLIAADGTKISGALIVSVETEGAGIGSVGCTVVREESRGRGIASRLVAHGTVCLKQAGMRSAFLGYTYSGLDKLYGRCGYRICMYYYMARKNLYNYGEFCRNRVQ